MSEPLFSDTNQLANNAIEAPTKLFEVSTTSSEGRTPGLILTKEQIISLRVYELAGLALPTELRDVENYLQYTRGAGKGLEPADFQKSFILIKNHALRWDPLRAKLKLVGSQLKLFAGDMQVYGATMEELYGDIKKLRVLEEYSIRTLEDVKKLELELGDKFPGIELDIYDQKTVAEFAYYLNKIFEGVEQRQREAEEIKKELDSFGRELEGKVLPEIQTKVHLIDTNSLPAETQALDAEIKARSAQIEELDKAYSESVKKSIASALGGGLAGLAMGIYAGVEAEKIRKQRNALKKEQSKAIETLQTKQKILASLHRVKLNMQDLELVVVDATAATHNLRTIWSSLYLYIQASHETAQKIDDALTVLSFMTEFRRVVRPWIDIENDAGLLLEVFTAADEEMRTVYGDSK